MLNTASLKMIDDKFLNDPVKPGFDGEERTTFLNTVIKHRATVEEVGTEEEKILKDRNASEEGKTRRLATLAAARLSDFAFVRRLIEEVQAAHTALRKRLLDPLTKKPDGNEVVTYLREESIRRSLGTDIPATFMKAVENDHYEITRAILDAPGTPLVSEEIRHRAEEVFMERTNPAAYERLQAVGHHLVHLRALADSTARWLVGLGADQKKVTAVLV